MTKMPEIFLNFLRTDYASGERKLGRAADLSLRYGTAAVFVLLAFGIRWMLTPLIGFGSPFMVLAPAALLAARFGGLGPGLAATAAGIILGDYYFTPPVHSWGPYGPGEITLITTYGIATTVGVLLFDRVQKSKRLVQAAARRAEAAAEQAEARGKELEVEIRERERVEAEL